MLQFNSVLVFRVCRGEQLRKGFVPDFTKFMSFGSWLLTYFTAHQAIEVRTPRDPLF
jgi:hypothetical protein